MFNRKNRILLNIGIIFIILFSFYCKKADELGILGIQVPIGKGMVTDKSPYIITGVYNPSPAYLQGIRPDDIILQINNVEIKKGMKYDYIFNNLLRGKTGEKVTLLVKRGDKKILFQIIYAGR